MEINEAMGNEEFVREVFKDIDRTISTLRWCQFDKDNINDIIQVARLEAQVYTLRNALVDDDLMNFIWNHYRKMGLVENLYPIAYDELYRIKEDEFEEVVVND